MIIVSAVHVNVIVSRRKHILLTVELEALWHMRGKIKGFSRRVVGVDFSRIGVGFVVAKLKARGHFVAAERKQLFVEKQPPRPYVYAVLSRVAGAALYVGLLLFFNCGVLQICGNVRNIFVACVNGQSVFHNQFRSHALLGNRAANRHRHHRRRIRQQAEPSVKARARSCGNFDCRPISVVFAQRI